MCGICGFAVSREASGIEHARFLLMRDSLAHRGPDDAGSLFDETAALGHRRLSIVDLSTGHQPMHNEDRTVWLSFNGEIYNHRELRPLMEQRGHRYATSSDTESIIHLYEEFGERSVEYLRGMFAFAIWDMRTRTLLLARDRLGIKPLYYFIEGDGSIYFSSEIKALIEAGVVRPEINYNVLPEFAATRSCSGDETLFKGVKRLLPGHTLLWNHGSVRTARYWDLSFAKNVEHEQSDAAVAERFSELFDDVVQSHLMSDVPLGVFLSGGIDSSAILSSMCRAADDQVKTFSVAFAEREANELQYARLAAAAYRTDHHEVVVSPENFFAALPALIYHEDEPIAHPSSVPLYFLSRLAARHVKVVLTGEGSDELLAGYDKYRKTIFNVVLGRAYRDALPETLRRAIGLLVESRRTLPLKLRQKLSRTFLSLPPDLKSIYFDNFSVFSASMQRRLFTDGVREQLGEESPHDGYQRAIDESDAHELLDKLLAADMRTYLHELLMKQDQMSMAASIESRVPFLDHKLVEFAASLPTRQKLRGLTTKYVLRRAMKHRLPREILSRRKMGFPVPVGSWLRGRFARLVDEYVLSPRARRRRIFDAGFTRELVVRHRLGENHTERLWMLINFEIWQRQFIDGERLDSKMPDEQQSVRVAV